MSSNKSKEHDNERNSLDQHREEDRTDSDGYEDHDTAANHEAQANELHDSVARDSSSDDSLYGSELNDVLDGRDGNDLLIDAGDTNKGENHLNSGILVADGSKFDQHIEEGRTDSDGYEYHYSSVTNHEAHGNELHDSVVRGSSSDDSLYGGGLNDVLDGSDGNDHLEGSDGDDILIGGGNTDKGENHLNGGNGDDILVAGGSKTSHLDEFLANHKDVLNIVTTNQKWGSVASIANSVSDDTGGGVHNIFDIHSNSGDDKIFNFHAATDKIQLDRELNGSDISDIDSLLHHIQTSGNDLSIDLGDGNTITLVGVNIAGLSANNIAWA